MIALLMFLFIAGGQKKPLKQEAQPHKVTVIDGDGNLIGQDGSKSVLLNFAEYTHLQDLRKAVVDEEKRLAVKYGAKPSCWDDIPKHSDSYCYDGFTPDHYEYDGQFLLIEKGKKGE